jgi:hypothetical protein
MVIRRLIEIILTNQLGLFILGFLLIVVPIMGIMVVSEQSKHENNHDH